MSVDRRVLSFDDYTQMDRTHVVVQCTLIAYQFLFSNFVHMTGMPHSHAILRMLRVWCVCAHRFMEIYLWNWNKNSSIRATPPHNELPFFLLVRVKWAKHWHVLLLVEMQTIAYAFTLGDFHFYSLFSRAERSSIVTHACVRSRRNNTANFIFIS